MGLPLPVPASNLLWRVVGKPKTDLGGGVQVEGGKERRGRDPVIQAEVLELMGCLLDKT